jgi:hypothetical protein
MIYALAFRRFAHVRSHGFAAVPFFLPLPFQPRFAFYSRAFHKARSRVRVQRGSGVPRTFMLVP